MLSKVEGFMYCTQKCHVKDCPKETHVKTLKSMSPIAHLLLLQRPPPNDDRWALAPAGNLLAHADKSSRDTCSGTCVSENLPRTEKKNVLIGIVLQRDIFLFHLFFSSCNKIVITHSGSPEDSSFPSSTMCLCCCLTTKACP